MAKMFSRPAAAYPAAGLVVGMLLAFIPAARADEPGPGAAKPGAVAAAGSLRLVPTEAAFYGAWLRNGEQIQAVVKSKAWAKLMASPLVKFGLEQAMSQAGPQNAQILAALADPDNQALLKLLADMGDEEIFFYGGEHFGDFMDLAQQLLIGLRYGPAFLKLTQKDNGLDANALPVLALLKVMALNIKLIKVPDMVVGFKLKDPKRAEAQLKRLEALLTAQTAAVPVLKGRFGRTPVGDDSFLTFRLDGRMIPWDDIPLKTLDPDDELDDLVKQLKKLRLTVSLGVRGEYLLFSLADSTDHLAKLGTAGHGLQARPEFAKLAPFADRPVTGISYVSKKLMTRLATTRNDLDELVEMGNQWLPRAPLPEEIKDRVSKDMAALAKDAKGFVVKPGGSLSFAFMTPHGSEGYTYNWTPQPQLDATKPLRVLDHVGGDPLFFYVDRPTRGLAQYKLMVKWLKTLYGYVEDYGLGSLNEDQRSRYDKVTEILFPALKRFDEITVTELAPALDDCQNGIVLDAKLKSQMWVATLPKTNKPIPVPELAIVTGVSDADGLRKAMAGYRELINKTYAKLREFVNAQESGVTWPEFAIPAPAVRPVKAGTLYYYPLPSASMLDKQVLPNAGLSESVGVLALSASHSERLLARTPLKHPGRPLRDTTRPLASASYLNWAATLDMVEEWVEEAHRQENRPRPKAGRREPAAEDPDPKPEKKPAQSPKAGKRENPEPEMVMAGVRSAFEFFKTVRVITSASYVEDGVFVTHVESTVQDAE